MNKSNITEMGNEVIGKEGDIFKPLSGIFKNYILYTIAHGEIKHKRKGRRKRNRESS